MTVGPAAALDGALTGAHGEPPAAGQVARRRWRRSRPILAAVLALIIVGIVLAALRPPVRQEYLDPDSPSQQGAQALVQITREHGTPVTVVRNASAAAEKMRAAPNAVLVIVRFDRLIAADQAILSTLPGDRLLVEPDIEALRALAPGVDLAGPASGAPRPGCSLPAATLAGNVGFTNSHTYDAPAGSTKCYLTDGKPNLVQVTTGGVTVTVLGSGQFLTNERLTENGNAALGMNLLGPRTAATTVAGDRQGDVVWLIPDLPKPGTAGHKSFATLVPFGVKLAVLQLFIAVVLVALWRARRLGPVVAEPLPVVVRSAEAVEGRARLYRARRARDRAADALRAGAHERLQRLLGLPGTVAPREIVSAIVARTGQNAALIGSALYGPPPVDDAALVRLAGFLDDLERQVRTS